MSGGFFRGTSAEQDTRFSNKQAKLLKTQKFAPELDQPVDMAKVKMDVIRPWIATRVTELLGFEDEVLINFVYGLLDGKVDGKQIQIQLTGFMEKNTGKFMRELWGLLLSAQNNASGVPQQFLDAKEEELKKKKAENDRITQEIQKRKEKEGRNAEIEREKKMDGEANNSKVANASSPTKHSIRRSSSIQPDEERDSDKRHMSRTRTRTSPSPSQSLSKSPTKSRSSSRERQRSKNESASLVSHGRSPILRRQYHSPRRRSMSSERRFRSPPRSSISPRRRYSPRSNESPSRLRSHYTRRGSPSLSRHRSPLWRRSPYPRRRSPSYERRRSPSPPRRRSPSPLRRRSPTPSRRYSPLRRSPVKSRRVSPSPLCRRSPIRRRSITPARHRSPSPVKRRSPLQRSPRHIHSPKSHPSYHIFPSQRKKRSPSPYKSPSQSYPSHKSSSRDTDSQSNPLDSNGHLSRGRRRRSPSHDSDPRENEQHDSQCKVSVSRSQSFHNSKTKIEINSRDHGARLRKSPRLSESPNSSRERSPGRDRNLVKKTGKRMRSSESPRTVSEDEVASPTRASLIPKTSSFHNKAKDLVAEKNKKTFCPTDIRQEDNSPSALDIHSSPVSGGPRANSVVKEDEEHQGSVNKMLDHVQPASEYAEDLEYGPGSISGGKRVANDVNSSAKNSSRDKRKGSPYELGSEKKSKKRIEQMNQPSSTDSEYEETASRKHKSREKRKYAKSIKHTRYSDYSSESDFDSDEDKKKAKRRKEEKKLRKEERRRKHEEKHRKKLERRADKMKLKEGIINPPSLEKDHGDGNKLADEVSGQKISRVPDATETEQKKLEIELREKALQTFRAKKATNN